MLSHNQCLILASLDFSSELGQIYVGRIGPCTTGMSLPFPLILLAFSFRTELFDRSLPFAEPLTRFCLSFVEELLALLAFEPAGFTAIWESFGLSLVSSTFAGSFEGLKKTSAFLLPKMCVFVLFYENFIYTFLMVTSD